MTAYRFLNWIRFERRLCSAFLPRFAGWGTGTSRYHDTQRAGATISPRVRGVKRFRASAGNESVCQHSHTTQRGSRAKAAPP